MTTPDLGPLPDAPLGVAVSGGGDSIALLMLLHQAGYSLQVATVDHQLRPESLDEAHDVAALCATLGISHRVLVWDRGDTTGNLQNEARKARQKLLTDWAQTAGLAHIVLGHTLDDQAETVLMRLARGSGVDGLAGMAAQRHAGGLCWHRPLLAVRRADLRGYLRDIGIGWVDDPSNDDLKYDRIKARRALDILAPLGLGAERLAETARHMCRARTALEAVTADLADRSIAITDAGEVQITFEPFSVAPREIQLRLLSSALGWVANAPYRPRFSALDGLLDTCLAKPAFGNTLHGCKISRNQVIITINREIAATPPLAAVTVTWDNRWDVEAVDDKDIKIKALGGHGLQFCPMWRDSDHSRTALMASPSLWRDGLLVAAPLANFGDKWMVNLAGGKKGFYDHLTTH
ncbi:MAG: tRNA lysidine(34) synthetase TilS [Rhodobacteraceae bacterium]|nr:tRNA lysidine(34) synthetase TilS [Paracoccaceae bacterium]